MEAKTCRRKYFNANSFVRWLLVLEIHGIGPFPFSANLSFLQKISDTYVLLILIKHYVGVKHFIV